MELASDPCSSPLCQPTKTPGLGTRMTQPLSHSADDAMGILARVRARYEQGLYLQAYEASQPLGDLRRWRGVEARLLAGRLAGNLGNGKLGHALLTLAWCADRDHPEATYRFARTLFQRRGPLRTWQF